MGSRQKIFYKALLFLTFFMVLSPFSQGAFPQTKAGRLPKEIAKIPLPKLIDFGASKCIPCKKMAPILQELTEEYEGKAVIKMIEVYQEPNLTQANGIQRIPTLIFFDSKNQEVHRHVGFMDKERIKAVFEKMGVHPGRK